MRIAVIPARGGSKRIPRKNVRSFCGRPVIGWPIEAARRSALFDHVLVSTDDREIAEIAVAEGAEVPFERPAELADDMATTTAVLAHATRWALNVGWPLSAVCCLYPTAPLVQVSDLCQGLSLLESGPWWFAFSATPCPVPVYRTFRELPDGGIEMLFPQHRSTRSQDLPRVLQDAGQFYWGRPQAWTESRPVFSPQSRPVILPSWRVRDIDVEEDWAGAERIFRKLRLDS